MTSLPPKRVETVPTNIEGFRNATENSKSIKDAAQLSEADFENLKVSRVGRL